MSARALDRAIELVAEGSPVDWDALSVDAEDDTERRRLDELRALTLGFTDHDGPPSSAMSWGPLVLKEEIGRGAHGAVYRAWDSRLDREVALKLLGPDAPREALDEARRLARVSHPSVVSIYGADDHDGRIGLWMELLRGSTLDTLLTSHGAFSAREAAGIGREVCSAIAAIHAAGLIHRDIKAQNVVREPGGRIVVMDLSATTDLAPDETRVASLAGTPLYMAPELFAGTPPGVASDIYAIGVLLYRLLTGAFPMEARTLGDVRMAHREGDLRPLLAARPGLPAGIVRVVEKCLQPVPDQRYASAATLERALWEAELAALPGAAANRGRRLRVAGASTMAVLMAAAALAWLGAGMQGNDDADQTHAYGLHPDQYAVFSGYEDLAFSRFERDPAGATAALRSALALERPLRPGLQGAFALLYTRLAEAGRRAGDAGRARDDFMDAEAHAVSVLAGEDPLTAIVALEAARRSQHAREYDQAARDLHRAWAAWWRGTGLSSVSAAGRPVPDQTQLARAAGTASCSDDRDGDGLLDLVEVVHGLNPNRTDSDSDGMTDDEEDHDGDGVDNGLALGLPLSAFLVTAASGVHAPASLGWQAHTRFPFAGAVVPGAGGPAWRVEAEQSMAFHYQRLPADVSARALQRGFSLLTRVQPEVGLASVTVDAAPHGARFDVLLERLNDDSVEIRLPSSIVPREGPTFRVRAPLAGPGLLVELRFRAATRSATLSIDGRRLHDAYVGHRQYQDPATGTVSFGVVRSDSTASSRPAARFGLVWLQVR
jgi:hypothetical protein